MVEIAIFFFLVLTLLIRPVFIPYLAIIHLFVNGLASRDFISKLKISLGSVNVYPLDLLYAFSALYFLVFFVRKIFFYNQDIEDSKELKHTIVLVVFYLLFYSGKLAGGLISGVPIDSLLRMYIADTQIFYFFLPLVIYKEFSQINRLLKFVALMSVLFPLYQPFLYGSADTDLALRAQDTLRLGFGDGNVLLGLGVLAFLCWEYKKYLAFLPMAGILMLGHRSGFIAIAVSFLVLSVFKGKKLKTIFIAGFSGVLMIGMLASVQSYVNVKLLDKLIERVERTFEPTKTTMVRARVITVVMEELDKRPYTGLDYKELYGVIKRADDSPRDFNIYHPHNFVYTLLMSGGLLGTVLILSIFGKTLGSAYKMTRSEDFKLQGAYLFSVILFFLIYALMNTTMTTVGYALWYLCGVTFWFFNRYKQAGYEQ